jgi:hypothetical protein
VSTFAVELSALSGPGLLTYLRAKPRLPFRYVSVHAPVKHQGLEDAALVQHLGGLPLWVRAIVAHFGSCEVGKRCANAYARTGNELVVAAGRQRQRPSSGTARRRSPNGSVR